jgi:hypothetical protein
MKCAAAEGKPYQASAWADCCALPCLIFCKLVMHARLVATLLLLAVSCCRYGEYKWIGMNDKVYR